MKALSVRSDFAMLICAGEKTIEVRSWHTAHRGPLLICATADRMPGTIPGHAICTADVVDVHLLTKGDLDAACMDKLPKERLFAWVLENIQPIVPVPVRGKPGIFDVEAEVKIIPDGEAGEKFIDEIYRPPLLVV